MKRREKERYLYYVPPNYVLPRDAFVNVRRGGDEEDSATAGKKKETI